MMEEQGDQKGMLGRDGPGLLAICFGICVMRCIAVLKGNNPEKAVGLHICILHYTHHHQARLSRPASQNRVVNWEQIADFQVRWISIRENGGYRRDAEFGPQVRNRIL